MFVVNFKLDFKKILLVCFILALLVVTIIEFGTTPQTSNVSSKTGNYDYIFTDENFTKNLKDIHNNIDSNIGKTVKISGFVFKMPDFKENYFVCGRNTISNNEDTIAGFLCEYKDSPKLIENEWVEITGVIIKGEYNETMPVIKVGNIKKITAPSNIFVQNINEQ
jgi:uncharacterized repeat protein (TIGR03943 family)